MYRERERKIFIDLCVFICMDSRRPGPCSPSAAAAPAAASSQSRTRTRAAPNVKEK